MKALLVMRPQLLDDGSVRESGSLEPLRKWDRKTTKHLRTVTEVGSGKRHFRYHAKVGMFEQETLILRSARPGMKIRPDCSLHANEYKHAHVATGKRFHGVEVGWLAK